MDLFRSFFEARGPAQIAAEPPASQQSIEKQEAPPSLLPENLHSNIAGVSESLADRGTPGSPTFYSGMAEHVMDQPIPIEQALAAYRSPPSVKLPKPAVLCQRDSQPLEHGPVTPNDSSESKQYPSVGLSEEPMPLSLPSSAENVSLVYQLCTNRNVTPIFDFGEPKPDFTWGCTLTVKTTSSIAAAANISTTQVPDSAGPGREIWESWDSDTSTGLVTVQDSTAYASKKMAKEHVSAMAIPILRCLPPFKKSPGSPLSPASPTPEREENWIGMLLEYCNAEGIPQASYQEFKQGNQSFSCELRVQNTENKAFGGRMQLYPNKKLARAFAARDDITWLKASGQYQKTMERQKKKNAGKARKPSASPVPATHAPKKPRVDAASPPPPPLATASIAHVVSDTDTGPEDESLPTNTTTTARATTPLTLFTVQVKSLCRDLNIAEPHYHTIPNPSAPSLFSCRVAFGSARDRTLLRFSNLPPTAYDDIGVTDIKVRDVAKEECARVLLGVLRDVRDNITLAKAHELNISPSTSAVDGAAPRNVSEGSQQEGIATAA